MTIASELTQMRQDLQAVPGPHQEWNTEYFESHQPYYQDILSRVEGELGHSGSVIEIGSIPCHLTYLLDRRGYDVTGVDLDPERYQEFIDYAGLDVKQANIETDRLPIPSESAKLVLLTEVFEHLRINPIHTLEEIHRILKPGGSLLLTTPNLHSIKKLYQILMFRGIGENPYDQFQQLEEVGHMGHVRIYSSHEVTDTLRRVGFSIESVEYDNWGRLSAFQSLKGVAAWAISSVIPQTRKSQIVRAGKS